MKNFVLLFCIVFVGICYKSIAQETEVDASKPTNLYTQFNAQFEYQSHKNSGDLFGTRLNLQYAFNPDNLLFVELPLLYNSATDKFGLSDTRLRYFYVPKRNLTERILAIAPFADITVPTGKFENGLGSSFWSLSAGMVVGVVITPKVALFPGLGYVHLTSPKAYEGGSKNGINIQTNLSVSFNKRMFVFINPILTLFDEALWSGEFNFNYMAKPNKLKFNIGYFPVFTNDIHSIRAGVTFFL
jgi:hypothetical protein